MGRKTNLLDEQASTAVKQLKVLLTARGRNAARNFMVTHLRNTPRLNANPRTAATPEQKVEWRKRLLVAADTEFQKDPPLCAAIFEFLIKDADFETGTWLARRKLAEPGVTATKGARVPADQLLREAAGYGVMDTELLLSISDLFAQKAKQEGRTTEDGGQFDLPAYLIGRLSVDRRLEPNTTLALINSVLRLPHYRFSPEVNETMLRLAKQRSTLLLMETPKGEAKSGGPSREDVWLAHMRAGIHLASHLAANDKPEAAHAWFDEFYRRSMDALIEFPQSAPLWGARLRLLHKWYKYASDMPIRGQIDRSIVRSMFNSNVKQAANALDRRQKIKGKSLPPAKIFDQSIVMRIARFERDAGNKQLGKKKLHEAILLNPDNPWPQTILQGWLAADREKPVKARKTPTVGKGLEPPKRAYHDKRVPASQKRDNV